jgi:DNA-binding CsgD family transcriptional regulator
MALRAVGAVVASARLASYSSTAAQPGQIADELSLGVETVRNHICHVLRALGAHSRLEAVAVARSDRLVAT